MKKLLFLLAIVTLSFTSCSKDDDTTKDVKDTKTMNIDASSKTEWNYYSLSKNKLIGTGEDADNAYWFSSKEWDIAISRYSIRTNSGKATTVNSLGGVYICKEGIAFENVELEEGTIFETDKAFTIRQMGGVVTEIIKSEASVIKFKTDDEGNMLMPPIYLKAPIYIFKSADGVKKYKIEFISYKNADGETGHVSFKYEEL